MLVVEEEEELPGEKALLSRRGRLQDQVGRSRREVGAVKLPGLDAHEVVERDRLAVHRHGNFGAGEVRHGPAVLRRRDDVEVHRGDVHGRAEVHARWWRVGGAGRPRARDDGDERGESEHGKHESRRTGDVHE